jgi:hypothetical protein
MSTRKAPVLSVTSYDKSVAVTISLFLGTLLLFGGVCAIWFINRVPPPPNAVPIEILDVAGGFEDGNPDETLRLDSPDPERADASLAEVEAPETEVAETLETLVEQSDLAAEQVTEQFETQLLDRGRKGSATGTGRRGLGEGPGDGGLPREQRWYVRFDDRATLNDYAKQLDFFGIELGVLLADKRLAYVSGMSTAQPMVRYSASGAGETRLYMTWQAGERRVFDQQLLAKAGVQLRGGEVMFHFYPPKTESQLAKLERDYQNRDPKMIRRTFFTVVSEGEGYTFQVTRQTLLK